jgi:predicted transposase YbfD/YdcC
MIKVRTQFEHTRPIDSDDKYYVVKIKTHDGMEADVGWIDKSFIKEKFLSNFKGIEIKNVRELSKEDYYNEKNK